MQQKAKKTQENTSLLGVWAEEALYKEQSFAYPEILGSLLGASADILEIAFSRLKPEYMLNPFYVEIVHVINDVYREQNQVDLLEVWKKIIGGDKKDYERRLKLARKGLLAISQITADAPDEEVKSQLMNYLVSCLQHAGSGMRLPGLIEEIIAKYLDYNRRKITELYLEERERNPQDDTLDEKFEKELLQLNDLAKIHAWQDEVRDLRQLTVKEPEEPLIYRGNVGFIRRADLHMISGPAGSMKSFFAWYMAMAAINDGKGAEKTLGFYAGKKDLKVGYVDTELNDDTLNSRVRILSKTCDGRLYDQERFKLLTINPLSKEQRKERVFDFIRSSDCDIIFVDSLRELCVDMNDVKETSELADNFKRLTTSYGKAVVVTSHTSKGTDFSRGHMGSQMNDLVAMEVSLRPDRVTKTVKVEFNKCRFQQPESFSLQFDHETEGIVEANPTYDVQELTRRQQKAKELFEKALKPGLEYGYSQILNNLMGLGVKRETARKYISDCVGVVLQKNDRKYILPASEPALDLDDDLPEA